ncbi:MAG TPA: trypsin-like serine protease [Kofleriaceae bacterium]|nr:trypsin-like serine protease [Kofleriaceae bacterium]
MKLSTLALALAACASPLASTQQAIIGGSADAGDSAVVMLAAYPADHSTLFTCTAEVVSPTALVTAGHCLDHTADYAYGVFYGEDASSYATLTELLPQLAATSATYIYPGYDRSAPFTGDIGVVVLAQATQVAPLAFARQAPTQAMVGEPARIVGYGQTVYNTFHESRDAADTTVAAIDAGDTITVGDTTHLTCVGDSGGPALVSNVIVGVDSYSDTTGCTQPAHFRRTDVYAAFIDQYAGTSAPLGSDAGPTAGADAGTGSDMETSSSGGGCTSGRTTGSGATILVALCLLRASGRRRRR